LLSVCPVVFSWHESFTLSDSKPIRKSANHLVLSLRVAIIGFRGNAARV
jgi:hypothetical protein